MSFILTIFCSVIYHAILVEGYSNFSRTQNRGKSGEKTDRLLPLEVTKAVVLLVMMGSSVVLFLIVKVNVVGV